MNSTRSSLAKWTVLMVVLSTANAAVAEVDWRALTNPRVGAQKTYVDLFYVGYCQSDIDRQYAGQNKDFSSSQYDLKAFAPVWQTEREEFALSFNFGVLDTGSQARLQEPDHFVANPAAAFSAGDLPDHLWNYEIGGVYRRDFQNGWIGGASLAIGSPSDRPFSSGDEISVNLNLLAQVEADENDAWLFMINLSNDRGFLPYIPLPGIAYAWNPSPDLRAIFGVPFSAIDIRITDALDFEATYVLLRNVHAQLNYEIIEQVWLYTAFDWSNQRWFRADREEEDDRLFYYEKTLAGGARWQINSFMFVDAKAGYAFDRFFFEGEDYDDNDRYRVDIDDGPFAAVQLGFEF